jgi:hypothetical protein
VTLPVVGPIRLTDLTREEAAQTVAAALGPYYTVLVVTVRVEQYVSNRALVLGRVSKPGIIPFETPPTLLEAITLAGALLVGGTGAEKAACRTGDLGGRLRCRNCTDLPDHQPEAWDRRVRRGIAPPYIVGDWAISRGCISHPPMAEDFPSVLYSR